jgi:formate dehydrogenase subunit gamma
MIGVSAQARVILGALAVCGVIAFAAPSHAQQPPTHAQQQGAPLDPEAHVVDEQQLLRQSPRIQGDILIPDQRESVLVQPAGRTWRYFHEIILPWLGAVVIVGMVALLTGAYFLLGPIRTSGRSGHRVARFNGYERFVHWLTATSFVVLGITGLNITFGKLLLRPLIGPDAFSAFSEAAKYAHNFMSVPFVLGLVLIVVAFIRDNIPDKVDVEWLRQGGGFIGSRHPPARRFNAGEKAVFWFALGAGAGVIVSGYLLIFPFYVTNILGMQIAQVVHALIAVVFVAVILAHIYIGTLGMEGAFEAMGTGSVDLNWAKEHHSLWLQEKLANGEAGDPQSPSTAPAE